MPAATLKSASRGGLAGCLLNNQFPHQIEKPILHLHTDYDRNTVIPVVTFLAPALRPCTTQLNVRILLSLIGLPIYKRSNHTTQYVASDGRTLGRGVSPLTRTCQLLNIRRNPIETAIETVMISQDAFKAKDADGCCRTQYIRDSTRNPFGVESKPGSKWNKHQLRWLGVDVEDGHQAVDLIPDEWRLQQRSKIYTTLIRHLDLTWSELASEHSDEFRAFYEGLLLLEGNIPQQMSLSMRSPQLRRTRSSDLRQLKRAHSTTNQNVPDQ